jgi:osmotically-inducible protein OsmY
MRPRSIISTLLLIVAVVGVLYYFYSYRHRDMSADISSAEKYTGEAATTSAVKTALELNKQVSSLDIHVETSGDRVTLSGQVPTVDDKRLAEEIAQSTKGVGSVANNLQVDPKVQATGTGGPQAGN